MTVYISFEKNLMCESVVSLRSYCY